MSGVGATAAWPAKRARECVAVTAPPPGRVDDSQRLSVDERTVVVSPPFGDGFGLLRCVEDFAIEQLVAELRVEALAVAGLTGATCMR